VKSRGAAWPDDNRNLSPVAANPDFAAFDPGYALAFAVRLLFAPAD
jgi:hypothetical protein